MERFIENYNGKQYDVIVIGGGISGASVAYEAASRGLSVALLEKNDFGSATSSATSKMIHGGLRYLAKMELGLVRESLRERRVLTNIAPNFIHPAPFLFSIYKSDKTPGFLMKIAMLLYEILSFDKGKLKDKSKKMPLHKTLNHDKVLKIVPNANHKGLKGAHLYYDCSSHSPERFTLAFIKSAVKYGADVANYAQMQEFIFDPSSNGKLKINGVRATDLINNKDVQINGKLVINCAGPWADIVLSKAKAADKNQHLRRSEGIHIITKKMIENYIFAGSTPNGKHFFVVPYRNHTLIGTTDKEYIGDPDNYKVSKKSIEELLKGVNQSFGNGKKIKYEDVLYTYGGLRPLVEDQTEDVYNSSRKYEITDGLKNNIDGLLTVEGGKFTTSRKLAEQVIKKAIKKLKFNANPTVSEHQYLYGSEIENLKAFIKEKQKQYPIFKNKQIEYLVKSYGNELDNLIKSYQKPEFLEPINPDGENLAMVAYAIDHEMAKTLSDILFRRTGIGLLGHPGNKNLQKIADLAAEKLGWTEKQKNDEILKIEQEFKLPE